MGDSAFHRLVRRLARIPRYEALWKLDCVLRCVVVVTERMYLVHEPFLSSILKSDQGRLFDVKESPSLCKCSCHAVPTSSLNFPNSAMPHNSGTFLCIPRTAQQSNTWYSTHTNIDPGAESFPNHTPSLSTMKCSSFTTSSNPIPTNSHNSTRCPGFVMASSCFFCRVNDPRRTWSDCDDRFEYLFTVVWHDS